MLSMSIMSSGSEGDQQQVMDEKKRKRLLSNRESARRSRMKKQKQMADLVNEKGMLERNICNTTQRYNAMMQSFRNLESENSVLRENKAKLNQYLEFLNLIINSSLQISRKRHSYMTETSGLCEVMEMSDNSQHIGV